MLGNVYDELDVKLLLNVCFVSLCDCVQFTEIHTL